jgi:hypothetical protein
VPDPFLGWDYVLGKKELTYFNPGMILIVSYSHCGEDVWSETGDISNRANKPIL